MISLERSLGLPNKKLLNWKDFHTIVFDFDGVFTNNKVWVDQNGVESVRCDRGDSLGFDMLGAFIKSNNWALNYFILSKEKNSVVSVRAEKLNIDCVQSISNKSDYIANYLNEGKLSAEGLIFLGNDLNDMAVMRMAGFSVAPSDAHALILDQADLVIPKKGGNGFVRAFIELLIGLEKMSASEVTELF
jgi:3-deoxy-D-manno-octulosonate 8-phosphate phosphatase (KDO 8-P phosphatase)